MKIDLRIDKQTKWKLKDKEEENVKKKLVLNGSWSEKVYYYRGIRGIKRDTETE